ncbi:T9SS type A sorting domain-containing protein [Gelidibacter maritimus]|uniref:T9SS type A sorting domain-containing protein n=1 Tax=Gelidibacter maritimus TaxID=2761487 RepID=A0A7W2M4J1_9FLAO|nr:T9SS type A sorting domain-containing protein [Gelidibacter maritimus]MBA6152581.1 T9SS type A sorting domain-containing protein [Gelidibacter maritimus]
MRKITFIFTMAAMFAISSSYSQDGNTINDPIDLDGSTTTPDLLNLGPATNSGLEPLCSTAPDIFFKHTISTGDNKFVFEIRTTAVAVSATSSFQLLKATNGDLNTLQESYCANYTVESGVGGISQGIIENVTQGDVYYLRVFKPTGLTDAQLRALAEASTISMVSSYDSTLSIESPDHNSFKIIVKPNSITFYNNTDYRNFSINAIDGKQVMSKNNNETLKSIDISSLDRGVYILTVENNGAFQARKFVKN